MSFSILTSSRALSNSASSIRICRMPMSRIHARDSRCCCSRKTSSGLEAGFYWVWPGWTNWPLLTPVTPVSKAGGIDLHIPVLSPPDEGPGSLVTGGWLDEPPRSSAADSWKCLLTAVLISSSSLFWVVTAVVVPLAPSVLAAHSFRPGRDRSWHPAWCRYP